MARELTTRNLICAVMVAWFPSQELVLLVVELETMMQSSECVAVETWLAGQESVLLVVELETMMQGSECVAVETWLAGQERWLSGQNVLRWKRG